MKSTKALSVVALTAAAILAASAAQATTFTGNAVGSWGTPTGTAAGDVYSISNNDNNGNAATSDFSFGVATSGSYTNLFTFNGANSFTTASESLFDIGSFTYRNGATTNYSQNTGVGLGILLHLSSPVSQDNNFNYNFSIDITPNNTGDPVLDGDIVSIMNGTTATNFTINGTTYTLALLGFSTDGGNTLTTQFLSPENSTANADVYAEITTNIATVPEPTSIALLGAGLSMMGFLRRRRPTSV